MERADRGTTGDQRRDHADAVLHVSAVARHVGHEFDEEREGGREGKPPDERPVARVSPLEQEPSGERQQRQRQAEPIGEDAQLLAALGRIEPLLRRGPQGAVRLDLRGFALGQVEPGPGQGGESLLDGALGGFQGVELLRPRDQAGILVDPLGGVPGLQPIGEGFARALGGGLGGLEGELILLDLPAVVVLVATDLFQGLCRGPSLVGIEELVEGIALLDLRKVPDDQGSQPDEEPREDQCDEPERQREPAFGEP